MAKKNTKKSNDNTLFSVDAKALVSAIDRVSGIVAGPEVSYCIRNGERLHFIGTRDDTFACVDLGEGSEGGQIIFVPEIQTFKGMVKGRNTLNFAVVGNLLEFKSGNFKGNLKYEQQANAAAVGTIEMMLDRVSKDNAALKVNAEFFKHVNKAVAMTRLTCQFIDNFVPTATVVFNGKQLDVVAQDQWHIHYYSEEVDEKMVPKKTIKPFTINVGTQIFGTIDKVVGSDLSINLSGDSFIITGEDIGIVLPPLQEVDPKMAIDFTLNLKKPVVSFKTDTAMAQIINNLNTLVKSKEGVDIKMDIKEGKIRLSHESDYGSAADAFKVKNFKGKEISLRLDPRIFFDTFRAIQHAGEFTFEVFNNDAGVPAIYRMIGSIGESSLYAVGYSG